jgi:hypothetical protein
MDQLKLSNVEHAFYKAGEAAGLANAMNQIAQNLHAAAIHYKEEPAVAEKFL